MNPEIEAARLVQSANRAKDERKKDTRPTMVLVACIALGNLILAIPALAISESHASDPCVGHFAGIRFRYPAWLLVYGCAQVVASALGLFCVALTCAAGEGPLALAFEGPLALFAVLDLVCVLFQFAWYVVGAVLLFTEITPTCAPGNPLTISAWRSSS
jgi:hypothetical protein